MKIAATFLAACLAFVSTANAAFDLQITEIYFGQTNPDPTSDWFEITNVGDMTYTEAIDGSLYQDDFSPDPAKADIINGITSIAPGESVIVLIDYEDDFTDAAGALAAWNATWNNISGVVVGTADGGSGLSSSKVDGPTIWLGDPTAGGLLLDTETYPDPDEVIGLLDGASYDVSLAAFSSVGNASGAIESVGLGGGDGIIPPFQASTASPGSAAIPEPSTLSLVVLSGLLVAARRR